MDDPVANILQSFGKGRLASVMWIKYFKHARKPKELKETSYSVKSI